MAIDLSSYRAVQTANYIKLVVPGYATLKFSDDTQTRTIDGDSYTNIGQLLFVSESRSEIRALEQDLSIGISGIPAGSVEEFLDHNPKGSTIEVRQALFDPATNALLSITGNPLIRFKGIVNNFSMEETWDNAGKISTFNILLQCNSIVSLIKNKINGRRTNDADQQALYPGDLSMSRVAAITRAQFQFGKPGGAQV